MPVSRKVDGVELETSLRVTDRLTLTANYGYTDSRYTEGTDSVLVELTGDGDYHDKKVPNVPEHTLILGGFVTAPVSRDAEAFLNVDYAYSTKRYTQANNFSWLGDDLTLNLRAGVQTESWTFTAYVRNLTDDDTPLASLDFVNFGTVDVNYPVNEYGKPAERQGPAHLLAQSEARQGLGPRGAVPLLGRGDGPDGRQLLRAGVPAAGGDVLRRAAPAG